jgi:hypothetical protein
MDVSRLFIFFSCALENFRKPGNDLVRTLQFRAEHNSIAGARLLPAADAPMSSHSNVSSPDVAGDPSNDATRTTAGHHSSGASVPQSSPVDRIVVGCPNCRATLRVRRVYLGNSVRCKNCNQIFLFEEPPDSVSKPAGDLPHAISTQQTGDQPQTNGGRVRTDQPYERLMGEYDRLLHEHGDLKSKYEVLELENERLHAARRELESQKQTAIDEIEQLRKTLAERDQALLDQSDQHRTEIDGERLARDHAAQAYRETLGRMEEEHRSTEAARKRFQDQCLEMAAALEKLKSDFHVQLEAEQTKQDEVRLLAADRDSLSAEVGRLSDQNRDLRAEQMANAQLATELQRHVADLAAARDALDRLQTEKQTAIDEIEEVRKTLAERDQAMLEQSERHRTALEDERVARDRVDQVFGESLRRVREEHRFTEAARKHFQDECLEMAAALEKLGSDYQIRLEAEQMKQKTLTDELLSLRAESDEATRLANQLFAMKSNPAEQNPAPDPELEAARAQAEDLTQWLMICERVNREMAEILSGLGIQMTLPVRKND